tara:strand:+ start:1781 stop:2245 length:465 start_codon:yes stop_codon:yes gene_type:complete
MRAAMDAAKKSQDKGDIPIGAVVVHEDRIIARAGNARKISSDPTAHAEILVLRKAAKKLGDWRLLGCTLYVTLEPCSMCAGALVLARLDRVVYGASDPKAGAVESLYTLLGDSRLNHQPDVTGGVLGEETGTLLRNFFRAQRTKKADTQSNSSD